MFYGQYWSRHEVALSTGTSVLTDLTTREKLLLIPLGMLSLALGLFPNLIFNLTSASVAQWMMKFSVE
jgi:NADH-quinone oxidoreductase subunit M